MENPEKPSKLPMPGPIPGPVTPDERTRQLGMLLIKTGIELMEAADKVGPVPLRQEVDDAH